jgi:ADP-ribose pyrophosphatase YjhB (NUDIX family)
MDILNKIKQIQALSEIGIHYAHNEFDLNRYQEMGKLCEGILAEMTGTPESDLRFKLYEDDGYKTAKVDVRAVIFNEKDEILLVREKIDGCWSLPGGWADVGYSPSEVAVKEAREEAGADVEPVRLLGVLDKRLHEHPSDIYYIYKIFIECRMKGWIGRDHLETSDAGFFPEDKLPELSTPRNTAGQMTTLFEFHRGTRVTPLFD